jgi:glycosyltransferase involved in cell wall biosynthesis
MKRFIAVQTGARRNYAVPMILEKAGMLEAFYTDLCANAGLGKFLDRWSPSWFKVGAVKRLLNRRVSANLEGKVQTFDRAALRYLWRQYRTQGNRIQRDLVLSKFNEEFGQAMVKKGLGNATHLFSMFGEGTALLELARQQHVKTITEIYISPLTYQIIREEVQQFNDLELPIPDQIIQSAYAWFERVCNLTDVFIVPSKFVETGLEKFGIDRHQCCIIPYGLDESWLQLKNSPVKGRILFVGTAEIRKGIHILGIAGSKLNYRSYEFRIAGGVSDRIRVHSLTQHLHFLGRIPRSEIQQEYIQADIFVLPTLAEGSAEVIYEALAVGIPVITTEAAGSVVRDGIEGFIIPERDPVALAERIELLVEDRVLRDRMATAAKERAKEYTWNQYAERLLTVFNSV